VKNTALLRRRILSRRAFIAVIGLGYEGLSLACAAAEGGFTVIGLDSGGERLADLRAGRPSVPGVPESLFRSACETGRLSFTEASSRLEETDILMICAPTPVRDHRPDLSPIEDSCRQVAAHLRTGHLVILESMSPPGTTDHVARPLLESSGLRAGADFLLAHSPHRIDPGNEEFTLRNLPKVVGGVTPDATGLATLFYGQLVDKVVAVSSCRVAELVKLLENAFRHVNIALANELAMHCHEEGIDVWEVLEAAETKPFGFMPFQPGPGVGGHGIPLESPSMPGRVRGDGNRPYRVLEQAQDVNARMAAYVAGRIGDALNETGKPVNRANILVMGVSYKPDVADIRESPALKVMAHLLRRGARVSFHDPYVESVTVDGTVLGRMQLTQNVIGRSDCVAILTPHRAYDLDWIAAHAKLVFDARNAFGPDRRPNVIRL